MTPQTFANDLENGRLPRQRVKCIVFDEAHRAVGNYAYCEVGGAAVVVGSSGVVDVGVVCGVACVVVGVGNTSSIR